LDCKSAILAFADGGKYIDQLVQYDPDTEIKKVKGKDTVVDTGQRWEELDFNFPGRSVECQADQGKFGKGDDQTKPYHADGPANVNAPSTSVAVCSCGRCTTGPPCSSWPR
jgi:hypothetical protein